MRLVFDPCGLLCVAIAYGIIGLSVYTIDLKLLPVWLSPAAPALLVLHSFLAVMTVWTQLRCMLGDPGFVPLQSKVADKAEPGDIELGTIGETAGGGAQAARPRGENSPPEASAVTKHRWCRKCDQAKPDRAHHCSTCNRCIHELDHHCPWMNACVARDNRKFFLQFLVYANLLATSTLLILVARLVGCSHESKKKFMKSTVECVGPVVLSMAIPLVFLAVIFGLFTCIMLCDQLSSVASDTTYIEVLQEKRGDRSPRKPLEQRTTMDGLRDVCRGPVSIWWCVPIHKKSTRRVA